MAMLRTFVAIELDENTVQHLESAVSILNRSDAKVKWVPPPNMHLSLSFLGDAPAEKIDEIEMALDLVAEKYQPFKFTVAGVGTFGRRNSPRVIWAGIQNASELMA